MTHWEISTAFWPLAAVQCMGLLAAYMTRHSVGWPGEACCRRCFLLLLGLLGVATMAAMAISPGLCLYSGTMLAVMLLTATWDVGLVRAKSIGP